MNRFSRTAVPLILLIFLGIFCIPPAAAESGPGPITVFGYENPVLIPVDRSDGPYQRMYQRFTAGSPVPTRFVILPGQRANEMFRKAMRRRDRVCEMPSGITHWEDEPNLGPLIESDPINWVRVYLMTLAGKSPLPPSVLFNPNAEPLRIGLVGGWSYGPEVASLLERGTLTQHRFDPAKDQRATLKMMAKGRVDAMLAYLPDLFLDMDATGIRAAYVEAAPVLEVADRLLCVDLPETRELIRHVNRELAQMRNDGSRSTVLGRFDMPNP
jgi:hypothetical protein